MYSVTSVVVLKLLNRYEPKKIVLEQVWGFTMRIEKGSTETPKL